MYPVRLYCYLYIANLSGIVLVFIFVLRFVSTCYLMTDLELSYKLTLTQVPPEDIRWVGDDPVIPRLGEAGAPNSGRGRPSSTNQFSNEMRPSRNGVMKDDAEEIEILHTDTLIKKVAYHGLVGISWILCNFTYSFVLR